MAFVPFYLIAAGTGSADINAGSTVGAATVGAQVHGTWVGATNTFTAASGTPFASTTTAEYASIYVDGATVTTYVAKIATVTSSTVIVLDGTIKYGTAPSDGSGTRSCVIGGSWNTEQVLAAGGLATTTVPQSTKVNIKGNLTITANRTITMAGATTAPLWFSGYNANPGDLDNDTTNTLAKPIWTCNSTVILTFTGAFATYSSLNITGSRSGTIVQANGLHQAYVRCRVTNTSSNAAAFALQANAQQTLFAYCYFLAPATGTTTGCVSGNTLTQWLGCVFDTGGLAGLNLGSNSNILVKDCLFTTNTGAGILLSTGRCWVINSTFYACTTDGIKCTGTPSAEIIVAGCLFAGPNGGTAMTNGINSSGGTTALIFRFCNDYYNVTNPEVGLGDSFAFFPQTDSLFPLVSATNLTPKAGSNARNHGFPGIVENETYSSFLDIGAVRHQDPAGFFIA